MDAIAAVTGHPLTSVSTGDDLIGADVFDALRRGERWAWERAYGVYARRLTAYLSFRCGSAAAASDAVSETFVRALNRSSRLRGGPGAFPTWLFRIARGVAEDALLPEDETVAISAADQEVLVLRLCAGLSCSEVARVLGKRPGAVRMRQLRALETLAVEAAAES